LTGRHNHSTRLSIDWPRRAVIAIRIVIAVWIVISIAAGVPIWIVAAIWAIALRRRNIGASGLRIDATHISPANLVAVIDRSIDHDGLIVSAAAIINLPAISAVSIASTRVIDESGLGTDVAFVHRKPAYWLNFAAGNHHWIISATLRQLVRAAFRITVNVDDGNRLISPRIAQNWARDRMIPGRWVANVPT
jgi:hypothetical protein